MIVPPEIKQDINVHSGYINSDSKFYNKNLKGLFYTNENKIYLSNELYTLITFKQYVKDNLPDDNIQDVNKSFGFDNDKDYIIGFNNKSQYLDKVNRLVNDFIKQKSNINRYTFLLMESYQLPFNEDLSTLNPVQQLHSVNLDFLVNTSKHIIQSPQNLIANFNEFNPDTGAYEGDTEYDFTAESYSDGTWHPEHLFTNSQRNKKNPYWMPLEVNIYSDPDAKGVGHKYNDILYNQGTLEYYKSDKAYDGTPKGGINQNAKGQNNSYGQFPGWQTTVNNRFYDGDNTGGLKDGGNDDRRVQSPHGYNMNVLARKPHFKK